jgi:pyruvate dehydrogenase (quinone)
LEAQRRMGEWSRLLDEVVRSDRAPLRPQMVVRAVSDLLADDAIISLDCGANTHFSARSLRLRPNQRLTGTGMLATMAPGLHYALQPNWRIRGARVWRSSVMVALRC